MRDFDGDWVCFWRIRSVPMLIKRGRNTSYEGFYETGFAGVKLSGSRVAFEGVGSGRSAL